MERMKVKGGEERGRRDGTHGDCKGRKRGRKRVRGKGFVSLPSNFFESQEKRGGKMSYIVPGADTLQSLFLMKPDRAE